MSGVIPLPALLERNGNGTDRGFGTDMAAALFRALKATHPRACVSGNGADRNIIDGVFELVAVAKRLREEVHRAA